jgi:hypothetical protein
MSKNQVQMTSQQIEALIQVEYNVDFGKMHEPLRDALIVIIGMLRGHEESAVES